MKLVEFKNVSGKNKKNPLHDISFTAESGYITAILGKNGAGKSTLFRCIMDEKSSYDGTIHVFGKELKQHRVEIVRKIGFVSEENIFFNQWTAIQNAAILAHFYDDWDEALWKKTAKEMKIPIRIPLQDLSRGENFKFQMAFAMAHKAQLYLIDEATAGMDPVYRKDFFRLLHKILEQEETGILMITHLREEVKLQMDYALVLENGRKKCFKEADQIGNEVII